MEIRTTHLTYAEISLLNGVLSHATFMLETRFGTGMDSTSPIASRIAGRTSFDSGTFFKSRFATMFLTLVGTTFTGRRCDLGLVASGLGRDSGPRRHRDSHHRLADGHGRAS